MRASYFAAIAGILGILSGCGGGSKNASEPSTVTSQNDAGITGATASGPTENSSGVLGAGPDTTTTSVKTSKTRQESVAVTNAPSAKTGVGNSTTTHRRTGDSMPSTYSGGGSDAKIQDVQH